MVRPVEFAALVITIANELYASGPVVIGIVVERRSDHDLPVKDCITVQIPLSLLPKIVKSSGD